MNIDEIIIYLRKSRADDPSMSVEDVLSRHESQLQDYAIHEYDSPVPENHIYREVVSGETIDGRPVMKKLLDLLESDPTIKGVLVIEPQRLSRGDLMDCGRIINTFRYTNTLVITPPKTYNLLDEYDRKFFEMELMRGNDYLEYTKKILNRGRIASIMQGNYIGSVRPYGYKKVSTGTGKNKIHTLEIIPEEADVIRLMFKLYLEGNGFRNIAHHLDMLGVKPIHSSTWSPAAISDMIENPLYIGKIRWNNRKIVKIMVNGKIELTRPNNTGDDVMLIDGKHPAIIDIDTFNAASERRGLTPKVKKFKELQNPFAGLLFCGTPGCGAAMSFKKYHQKKSATDTITKSMLCNKQSVCHTKSVQYDAFLEKVKWILQNTIQDFEVQIKNDPDGISRIHQNLVSKLELELEKLYRKDQRQKDAYEDGTYTKKEYIQRNLKLQEQISNTLLSLEAAKSECIAPIDYSEKIVRFQDALAALNDDSVPASKKNLLLKACIDKIYYINNNESRPGIGRYVDNVFDLEVILKL